MKPDYLTDREREDYDLYVEHNTEQDKGHFRWFTCAVAGLCGGAILVGAVRLMVLLSAWVVKLWHIYFGR